MGAQRNGPGANRGRECSRAAGDSSAHCTAPADRLLPRLDGVQETASGCWIAKCPAHDDRTPSLSIRQADDRVLVYCFAGCPVDAVLDALGLSLGDLFDRPLDHHRKPLSPRQRRRYGQAQDALKVLDFEALVVQAAADDLAAGFALDKDTRERLSTAVERIREIRRIAA